MHLRAICTLFASTCKAYFVLEVLIDTHLHAFSIAKTVVFWHLNTFVNYFGGVLSHTPPCDLHIICDYFFTLEVRGDSGLYNTK